MSDQLITIIVLPLLMVLVLIVILKFYAAVLEKLIALWDKHVPERTVRYGPLDRVFEISMEVFIGSVVFVVFFHIFSAPIFFINAIEWSPPVFFVLILAICPFLFSGIITYKIIRMIHGHFRFGNNVSANE
jgi:hypothetical protein